MKWFLQRNYILSNWPQRNISINAILIDQVVDSVGCTGGECPLKDTRGTAKHHDVTSVKENWEEKEPAPFELTQGSKPGLDLSLTSGRLNEEWHCEGGCAANIIPIFGKQQGSCGVGEHFCQCHWNVAQSDRTGKRPADRCFTEPKPGPNRGRMFKPPLLFPIWLGSCGFGEGLESECDDESHNNKSKRLKKQNSHFHADFLHLGTQHLYVLWHFIQLPLKQRSNE